MAAGIRGVLLSSDVAMFSDSNSVYPVDWPIVVRLWSRVLWVGPCFVWFVYKHENTGDTVHSPTTGLTLFHWSAVTHKTNLSVHQQRQRRRRVENLDLNSERWKIKCSKEDSLWSEALCVVVCVYTGGSARSRTVLTWRDPPVLGSLWGPPPSRCST